MANVFNSDEHIRISKQEMKRLAIRYVHQWANLNSIRTDDDFYNDCMVYEVKNQGNDGRQVEFTEKEKEWARKEFEVIDNWLTKRRNKYEAKIKS